MKNKNTAAFLAFLLGGLGAQNIYLGELAKALLKICFCWTFIPLFLGIIDAFSFWSMDERKFNGMYNYKFMPTKQTA